MAETGGEPGLAEQADFFSVIFRRNAGNRLERDSTFELGVFSEVDVTEAPRSDAAEQPGEFFMRLSPRTSGPAMLPDCLSHPLSILAATLPDDRAQVHGVTVDGGRVGEDAADVEFIYEGAGRSIRCRVELVQCEEPPRPAAYGFDGRIAERTIEMEGYKMALEAEGRRIPLPDPTPLLVRSFIEAVTTGAAPRVNPAARPGMRHLLQIVEAAEHPPVSP